MWIFLKSYLKGKPKEKYQQFVFCENYDHGGGHRATYFSSPSEGTTHWWGKRPKRGQTVLKTCVYSQLLVIMFQNKSAKNWLMS